MSIPILGICTVIVLTSGNNTFFQQSERSMRSEKRKQTNTYLKRMILKTDLCEAQGSWFRLYTVVQKTTAKSVDPYTCSCQTCKVCTLLPPVLLNLFFAVFT